MRVWRARSCSPGYESVGSISRSVWRVEAGSVSEKPAILRLTKFETTNRLPQQTFSQFCCSTAQSSRIFDSEQGPRWGDRSVSNVSRRDFLKTGGQAAMAIAIADAALSSSWAQSASATTRVVIDPSFSTAPLDRHIFGSFLEHLGR